MTKEKIVHPEPQSDPTTRAVSLTMLLDSPSQGNFEDIITELLTRGITPRRILLSAHDFKVYQDAFYQGGRIILSGGGSANETFYVWAGDRSVDLMQSPTVCKETCLVEAFTGPGLRKLGRLELATIAETAYRCARVYAKARGFALTEVTSIAAESKHERAALTELINSLHCCIQDNPHRLPERKSFLPLVAKDFGGDQISARVFFDVASAMIRAELDIY